MRARWLRLLLLATPGCSSSLQAGAEVKTLPTAPLAVQGVGSLSGGLTDLFIPKVSFGVGATPEGRKITTFEVGFEVVPLEYEPAPDPPAPKRAAPAAATRAVPTDEPEARHHYRWSYRVGPTVGGVLAGPGGVYLGLRGGPTYALSRPRHERFIPLLNLGLLAGIGMGGEIGGGFVGGVGLGISYDSHGTLHLPHGRPLRVGERCVVAEVRRTSAWKKRATSASRIAPAPRTDDLPDETRRALGEAWLREALLEHASIPAFERLARELALLGAPRSLVRRAAQSARDEIVHAQIAFGLASAYLGFDVGPGPLDAGDARACTPEMVAVESLVDGCFGEGLSAAVAEARSRRAVDPWIAGALARIARDEARHARLGWDVLAWCLRAGDARTRDAVRVALADIERAPVAVAVAGAVAGADPVDLGAYGIADPGDVDAATQTLAPRVLERARSLVLLPTFNHIASRRSFFQNAARKERRSARRNAHVVRR